MHRHLKTALALIPTLSLTACLGTIVETPTPRGKPVEGTHAHILAGPFRIDAHTCKGGMSRVVTFVPLWGVAVGILTFGIVVPKTTSYSCVKGVAR